MIKRIRLKKLGMISGPFLLLCFAIAFAGASSDEMLSAVRLFDLVAYTVFDKYVDAIEPEKIARAGVNGLMEKLDPYSQYLAGGDYSYLLQETHGEYVGIGVQLENAGDTLRIAGVIDGSPAKISDLRIGDRLLLIDSIEAIGLSRSECLRLFRGKEGSRITIRIWRPAEKAEMVKKPIRARISQESIAYHEIDTAGIGYIKCVKFSEGCAAMMRRIINDMRSSGLKGLIIDLRHNPGGLLYEAVETAALFLHKGDKIVETRGRSYNNSRSYEATQNGICDDLPLVIVIDGQTASAAEIVAGAIQDHDRGLIVGQESYGKGLVQQIFQISGEAAVKLTTAKYYTPSNRCINRDSLGDGKEFHVSRGNSMVYLTKSGRNVFGGGGIIPDIYVDRNRDLPLIDELLSLGLMTDFVLHYTADKRIGDGLEVSDEIFEAFERYLYDKGFLYHSPVDREFGRFLKQYRTLENDKKLAVHLNAVRETLQKRSRQEITASKPAVCAALYERFIEECLGQQAAVRLVSLRFDPELLKARELLMRPPLYSSYLAN